MSFEATEDGRKLKVTFGGGTDDQIDLFVSPAPFRVGQAILSDWVNLRLGAVPAEDAATKGTELARAAVGAELFGNLEAEDCALRPDEVSQVVNAAVFWQAQGGGIELVSTYQAEGLEAAQKELMATTGMDQVEELFRTVEDQISVESEAEALVAEEPTA